MKQTAMCAMTADMLRKLADYMETLAQEWEGTITLVGDLLYAVTDAENVAEAGDYIGCLIWNAEGVRWELV
jgi:hypothetical protein